MNETFCRIAGNVVANCKSQSDLEVAIGTMAWLNTDFRQVLTKVTETLDVVESLIGENHNLSYAEIDGLIGDIDLVDVEAGNLTIAFLEGD